MIFFSIYSAYSDHKLDIMLDSFFQEYLEIKFTDHSELTNM